MTSKAEQEASRLMKLGYFCVSRRFCLVSRIDFPDWRDLLAKHFAPWDPNGEGAAHVQGSGSPSINDYYRRVLSKDTLVVDSLVIRHMVSSGSSYAGYIAKYPPAELCH